MLYIIIIIVSFIITESGSILALFHYVADTLLNFSVSIMDGSLIETADKAPTKLIVDTPSQTSATTEPESMPSDGSVEQEQNSSESNRQVTTEETPSKPSWGRILFDHIAGPFYVIGSVVSRFINSFAWSDEELTKPNNTEDTPFNSKVENQASSIKKKSSASSRSKSTPQESKFKRKRTGKPLTMDQLIKRVFAADHPLPKDEAPQLKFQFQRQFPGLFPSSDTELAQIFHDFVQLRNIEKRKVFKLFNLFMPDIQDKADYYFRICQPDVKPDRRFMLHYLQSLTELASDILLRDFEDARFREYSELDFDDTERYSKFLNILWPGHKVDVRFKSDIINRSIEYILLNGSKYDIGEKAFQTAYLDFFNMLRGHAFTRLLDRLSSPRLFPSEPRNFAEGLQRSRIVSLIRLHLSKEIDNMSTQYPSRKIWKKHVEINKTYFDIAFSYLVSVHFDFDAKSDVHPQTFKEHYYKNGVGKCIYNILKISADKPNITSVFRWGNSQRFEQDAKIFIDNLLKNSERNHDSLFEGRKPPLDELTQEIAHIVWPIILAAVPNSRLEKYSKFAHMLHSDPTISICSRLIHHELKAILLLNPKDMLELIKTYNGTQSVIKHFDLDKEVLFYLKSLRKTKHK